MNMTFATPWVLMLLPVALALALYPLFARERTKPAGMRYSDNSLTRVQGRSPRLMLRPVLPALRWIAVALVVVSAARPQSSEAREVISGEGVDIALALDISGSMAALDFEPLNRLEAATDVIANFIDQRKYDRIGLVVFASEAFVQSPPTIDHRVLFGMLGELDLAASLGLEDGTAIGLGLATGANMLKNSESASKIVVLLTDGVNNKGNVDPITAAIAAETLGIKVYTIGMGDPDGVLTSRRGLGDQLVIQRYELDEETLQQIADTTGGKYFRATNAEGLREIYDEINELETSEIDVRQFIKYRELSGWFLVPVPLLLLLELLAGLTFFRTLP
jgi:Ca-activated chloride channel family protein